MEKTTLLESIKKIKQSHLTQVQKIEYLVNNIPFDAEPTAVSYKACFFGQWFYSNEAYLRSILFNQQMDEVERLHILWHEEYLKIYQLFYPEKKGLLSKLISKKPKTSLQDLDRAKAYFADLKEVTDALIKKIDLIEKRINSMPMQKFSDSDA